MEAELDPKETGFSHPEEGVPPRQKGRGRGYMKTHIPHLSWGLSYQKKPMLLAQSPESNQEMVKHHE